MTIIDRRGNRIDIDPCPASSAEPLWLLRVSRNGAPIVQCVLDLHDLNDLQADIEAARRA